jgi:hypothetical protein
MAIKRVNYSKEFVSETDLEDVSRQGSPQLEPYQKISSEDERLRQEIDKNFSLRANSQYFSLGFDGTFVYLFGITSNLKEGNNPEENRNYQTTITIKKAGNQRELDNPSDLEEFLINSNFKKNLMDTTIN